MALLLWASFQFSQCWDIGNHTEDW